MIEASPSPRGQKAARLPLFAVADRAAATRPAAHERRADAAAQGPANYDPVDYSGTAEPAVPAGVRGPSVHERGGYAGGAEALAAGSEVTTSEATTSVAPTSVAPTSVAPPSVTPTSVAVTRDAADLDDLSHSQGDGARYAVDLAVARWDAARTRRDAAAAQAAKLRLQQALNGVRWVCTQAMRQRMHTEMTDLASQIRKMHDGEAPPR